ncbi:MAG: hypothetical protein ABMA13_15260 [Chthoniobacteraceae bacterium]
MSRFLLSLTTALIASAPAFAGKANVDLDAPAHRYHERELKDRFTLLKPDLEAGKLGLDESSEKAFLLSMLAKLNVPVSSQMLVFSTTSLQLRFIRQDNPRALFFTDDLYVGYIPGGRFEIVSIDPELGAVFYIFDMPRPGQPVRAERSERCMNCHADDDTGGVPGLVVKSVVPGVTGGSLDALRVGPPGHDAPFEKRFGGWYVTGDNGLASAWGNAFGRWTGDAFVPVKIDPATRFDANRYPLPTSDVLPQLLHEHQAGFVNRVVRAGYAAREALHASGGRLTPAQSAELDEQARIVTRYLLFADEAPLPAGGVAGDAAFKADFLRTRLAGPGGASLRDFDLKTRMFRHRCSYMIHSAPFHGLPPEMKQRIFRQLSAALNWTKPVAEYAYLPTTEKQAIVGILRKTLPGLPPGW